MKKIFDTGCFLICMMAAVSIVSCKKDGPEEHTPNILVIYSAGANDLERNLDLNIEELSGHYLPAKYEDNKVIVVSQRKDARDYLEQAEVFHLYRDDNTGAVKSETLTKFPATVNIADIDGFVSVMEYIKRKYPEAGYSMIFSSHGTGWMPANYPVKKAEEMVYEIKSLGLSYIKDPATGREYMTSIDIREMATMSPVHFDCIVMDACLMGGVEVAYELRNIADKIIFSSAEIPTAGIDYYSFIRRMLAYDQPDYDGICRDYMQKSVNYGSGVTISMVDCSQLSNLENLCQKLFNKYDFSRTSSVLNYCKNSFGEDKYHYSYCFSDFFSLAVSSGLSPNDLSDLIVAMMKCVPYRYCSLRTLHQECFYGLSIFNPYYTFDYFEPLEGSGMSRINVGEYYKTLEWNKATGLVK